MITAGSCNQRTWREKGKLAEGSGRGRGACVSQEVMKRHPHLGPGMVSEGWEAVRGGWLRRKWPHRLPRRRRKASTVCHVCGAADSNVHRGVTGLRLAISLPLIRLLHLEWVGLVKSKVCLCIFLGVPESVERGDSASRSQCLEREWQGNVRMNPLTWHWDEIAISSQ